MFLEHYGLIEQPFGVTPDPRFLHLGPQHREALAALLYGTETNRAFLALIAKPGMGKTSLLVQYRQRYEKRARICHLFQTDCDTRELLRQILGSLGIDGGGKDLPGMRDLVNQVLMEEMLAGRRFVLVIDEAQNLDEKVLESVRLLSNFETPTKKLILIVLAGQPQLAERLARPSMVQFRQRISTVIRLDPFTREETNDYINHRLRIAGYKGSSPFTDRAHLLIAEHSVGIPRNINTLCFNAMSLAYAIGSKQIDSKIVREVISDLEIESLVPRSERAVRSSASRQAFVVRTSTATSAPTTPHRRGIRVRGRPSRARLAIASFAAVMVLGVASGIAWNRGVRTSLRTIRSTVEAAIIPQALSSNKRQKNDHVLTIVVEKDTTLHQLSLKNLGRFDQTTLGEICKLNPEITDPNRIQAGQRLRLPLSLQRILPSDRESSSGAARVVPQEEKP